MKVMFAGSPEVAVPSLAALVGAGIDVVGVVSQPAKPWGRKRELRDTAVSTWALDHSVPRETPLDADALLQVVTQWKPDIAVVVAYGRLLSPDVLASVAGGWWNAHFSLLPLWRGAAPVPHAILAGDTTTGVTLFRLDQGLDTGDIAATIPYDIAPHDTTGSVLATLGERAAAGIVDLVKSFAEGSLITHAQQGHTTYAPKPAKDFGALDLTANPQSIDRRFRAATPEPGAYVHRSDTGDRINILQMRPSAHERSPLPAGELRLDDVLVVGTGGDPLELERVQPAGKKPMSAPDWFRGLPEGVVLHG